MLCCQELYQLLLPTKGLTGRAFGWLGDFATKKIVKGGKAAIACGARGQAAEEQGGMDRSTNVDAIITLN
jgi:hypothetical protein